MGKKCFLLYLLLLSVQLSIAQSAHYEYWIDNGYAGRTMLQDAAEDVTLDLDVSNMSPGLHYFSFRTHAADGRWGAISRYMFLIREQEDATVSTTARYEYWLDNEYDKRTVVAGGIAGSVLNLDINSLKPGLHYFNFRTQGRYGLWGGLSRYLFYIKDQDVSQLSAIRYWIDERNDVMTQQVTDDTVVLTADISRLSEGTHTFYVEGVTASGAHCMLNGYEFTVSESPAVVEPYAVLSDNNTVLTFYYDDQKTARGGLSVGPFEYDYDGSRISFANAPSWYANRSAVTRAIFDPSFADCTSITSTGLWFYGFSNLTAIEGLNYLNTGNVTDMGFMFRGCSSLTSLDVSGFNTSKVERFNGIFSGCSALTSIGVNHFDTSNAWDFRLMFDGCSSLTELDVSNFRTENVIGMGGMFEACSSLKKLDLRNFNTEKVFGMGWMFANCFALTDLDISSFNTSAVGEMNAMFGGCSSLTHLNLAHFNTSNVTLFNLMFADCSSLASIQAGSAAIPDSIYAQIGNPNLLVYVNEASLAPSSVQNVVINETAREIVLTDVTSGNNNFYVPQAFTAERISYTRNFAQSTQVGVSRGWESIALPFDVQTITHETKGTIAPFGNTASNRHFWLRELGSNGLQSATGIAANTPYVISMPNSSDYTDNNNLAGRVTFAAENATIPVTEVKASAMADQSIVMIPTMQRQERSSEVWALNVGEVRGRYLEGSVFERDYREVRPFEAYTVHREENSQPAPRYVPLQEIGGTTGINVMEDVRSKKDDVWYTTDGRKLQGKPSAKGVYINNGQKIVIR